MYVKKLIPRRDGDASVRYPTCGLPGVRATMNSPQVGLEVQEDNLMCPDPPAANTYVRSA